MFLNREIREKDQKFQDMLKCVCKLIKPEVGSQLMDEVTKVWDVESDR